MKVPIGPLGKQFWVVCWNMEIGLSLISEDRLNSRLDIWSGQFIQLTNVLLVNSIQLDTDVFVLLTAFYLRNTFLNHYAPSKWARNCQFETDYQRLGDQRAEALIGWYAFKGTWLVTGGFVSKALKSNFKAFLAADNDILMPYLKFGCSETVALERVFRQMERYEIAFYTDLPIANLKHWMELRWALFAKAGKEGRQTSADTRYFDTSYKTSLLSCNWFWKNQPCHAQ